MDCPDCGEKAIAFVVPDEYREFTPDDDEVLALCPTCLGLHPTADADPDPDFARVGEAFPSGAAAIPMALALGLLDSLALHRSAIETLLERVERAGADPLLVLDRLAADPEVDARMDLDGRRRQVAQFRG